MHAFLPRRMDVRTGHGFDAHRLELAPDPAEGDMASSGLWLCGVCVTSSLRALGHSDADVALHALTDALLGAVCAGDIGDHFPPQDPQWRGAASSLFVKHAMALIQSAGGRVNHADITIIAERPHVSSFKKKMTDHVASLLNVPTTYINIKATTTEGMGYTGRGEGIAAHAVATVIFGEKEHP